MPGFAVHGAGAHLAVRKFAPWADPLMLPLAALLNGLGIVMIYRLQESGRSGNPGLQISTLTATRGPVPAGVDARSAWPRSSPCWSLIRQPRILQRYTYTLGTIGLILLAIPALLPASHERGQRAPRSGSSSAASPSSQASSPGSRSRCSSPGTWSPSGTCSSLAGRRFLGIDLPRGRDLGPILVLWAISLLILIFESDIGTSALFFGLFIAMLYIATQRKSWLLIGLLLFVAGALLAGRLIPHVHERFDDLAAPVRAGQHPGLVLTSWCRAWRGWRSAASSAPGSATASRSAPRSCRATSSSPAFGEELGLTGLMALLLIFGLLVQRGLRAAMAVRDPFAKLLAGGLSFVLALQVFIIVGGVTQLIPLTGITTPFLSQGGSSLVASWMLIALLMRISDTRQAACAAADPGRGHDPGGAGGMNRAIRRLSIASLGCSCCSWSTSTTCRCSGSTALASKPCNVRVFTEQFKNQRGEIIAAGDAARPQIAGRRQVKRIKGGSSSGSIRRPRVRAGHRLRLDLATTSPFGQTGIEKAENKFLAGTAPSLAVHNLRACSPASPSRAPAST